MKVILRNELYVNESPDIDERSSDWVGDLSFEQLKKMIFFYWMQPFRVTLRNKTTFVQPSVIKENIILKTLETRIVDGNTIDTIILNTHDCRYDLDRIIIYLPMQYDNN